MDSRLVVRCGRPEPEAELEPELEDERRGVDEERVPTRAGMGAAAEASGGDHAKKLPLPPRPWPLSCGCGCGSGCGCGRKVPSGCVGGGSGSQARWSGSAAEAAVVSEAAAAAASSGCSLRPNTASSESPSDSSETSCESAMVRDGPTRVRRRYVAGNRSHAWSLSLSRAGTQDAAADTDARQILAAS